MKTRREWYQLLPEDIREKAIKNTDYLEGKCESLHRALNGGFTFSISPEGSKYWNEISSNLYKPYTTIEEVMDNLNKLEKKYEKRI